MGLREKPTPAHSAGESETFGMVSSPLSSCELSTSLGYDSVVPDSDPLDVVWDSVDTA